MGRAAMSKPMVMGECVGRCADHVLTWRSQSTSVLLGGLPSVSVSGLPWSTSHPVPWHGLASSHRAMVSPNAAARAQ